MNPEKLGYYLHAQGFETWFRYIFRAIEQSPFKLEPIHDGVFELFQDIFENKEKRTTLNIPPRSAKTTLATYFIAFSWTKNPKYNFIYTSFSQDLLHEISSKLALILEHPVYKAMYPTHKITQEENFEDPFNDFWVIL